MQGCSLCAPISASCASAPGRTCLPLCCAALLSPAQLVQCMAEAAAVNDTRGKHMDQAWLGKLGRQRWLVGGGGVPVTAEQ